MTRQPVPSDVPRALVFGFGGAVAMWAAGFVLRLPGVLAAPWAIVGVFGLIQLMVGARMGGARGAAMAGAVTALLNLLLVGSLVSDPETRNALRAEWMVLVGGWLIGMPVVSALGAMVFKGRGARTEGVSWLARFAAVDAVAAFILLVVGGLVTSLEAGLAVPDWPNSFGYNMFLLPLAHMQGGVYFEHYHRLFGSLVGLTTLVLMVWTLLKDPRGIAKTLGIVAFLFVVGQGILGGLRVTGRATLSQTEVEPNLALAFVHGVTGQMFVALLAAFACILSARWTSSEPARESSRPGSPRLICGVLLGFLIVQLLLGSATRHFDQGPGFMHTALTHAVNAVLVLAVAVGAGLRAAGAFAERTPLRVLGKATMHTVGLQMLLGAAALWAVLMYRKAETPPLVEVGITTGHQAVGAALLALAAMLFVWSRRLVLRPRK
ncbi:MAG: COX15/CtaA family protein [Phycisphaerales bacterium]